MIRHALGFIFSTFIGIILFVNLYQFSGAILPFELPWSEAPIQNFENSMFGFSSLFTFIRVLGNDSGLQFSLTAMNTAFRIIRTFSIDDIVDVFVNINNVLTESPGWTILFIIASIFTLIKDVFVLPFAMILGFIVLIFGIFLFVWQLLTYLFKFMLGFYNVDLSIYSHYATIVMTNAFTFR